MYKLLAYRKICEIDVQAQRRGDHGHKRFEHDSGSLERMTQLFEAYSASEQVLAVEVMDPLGTVILRSDKLLENYRHSSGTWRKAAGDVVIDPLLKRG